MLMKIVWTPGSMAECLPSMCKDLGSVSSTRIEKRKDKNGLGVRSKGHAKEGTVERAFVSHVYRYTAIPLGTCKPFHFSRCIAGQGDLPPSSLTRC